MDREELRMHVLGGLTFAQKQVRNLVENHPDFYPLYTHKGKWKHDKPAWTQWCDGFLPGMMWLFLESGTADDDAYWLAKAEHYSANLLERKEDRDVHDLGFIFYHGTYKRWYEHTLRQGNPRPELDDVVIRAGQVLAMRFKEKGQYLRSFISDESLFIDIMMNVPVIFYAAQKTGDEALYRTALAHCETTRRVLVRGDGSTSHEGIFDTATGEFLRQTTHQGYRGDSCWSRGLGWSLYGFGTVYHHTDDPRFLQTAEQHAEYVLANSPLDGILPWDYNAPEDRSKLDRNQPDTSASAIIACGLFNLAKMTKDPIRQGVFIDTALTMVESMLNPEYLAVEDDGFEGILKRQVYHIHKDYGVDEACMFGEFFFVEALTKALDVL
ncbi:MAG: glycoside hydrolase family 88 protein [Phycisphaerae bacterium]